MSGPGRGPGRAGAPGGRQCAYVRRRRGGVMRRVGGWRARVRWDVSRDDDDVRHGADDGNDSQVTQVVGVCDVRAMSVCRWCGLASDDGAKATSGRRRPGPWCRQGRANGPALTRRPGRGRGRARPTTGDDDGGRAPGGRGRPDDDDGRAPPRSMGGLCGVGVGASRRTGGRRAAVRRATKVRAIRRRAGARLGWLAASGWRRRVAGVRYDG